MAMRKVIESDISGKAGAATVTFGLKDTWFEIDLTDEEREELEKTLERYATKGRKATGKGEKKRLVPETTPEEREQIREWGRQNNFEVPPYGRIPKKVQKAYDEAHNIERSK
ncbi:Lsr2 family protein [Pseudarthrobacter sp. GA104]|uniref:histone-like nucleoid-structuring protein Lsr2 n=1 Tax=Pseudarthrobacter sp. GA104 TaxID=2676311 RepID=UPI0012FC0150|nr:Lsr2 family protein [Pseudarthrobacter sp. GA104]MUU73430.1 Lsr2 family protein [Pseudarthrobacter sp. GA104]